MEKTDNFSVPATTLILVMLVTIILAACGGGTPAASTSTSLPASPISQTSTPDKELPTALSVTPTHTAQPTQTPVPSATHTQVPSATPTTVPQIDPGQIAGDPVEVLGDPDWIDTFDTSANWTLYNNDCFRSKIENGKMVMTGLTQNICWLVTLPKIQNYYLEVTMDTSSCPAGGEFGLYFRGPETSSGYSYTLSCTINYLLVARNGQAGTKTTFLDEPVDPELAWPTWENRLGVLAIGNHYRLYVNGVFLSEVSDDQFTEAGLIGLVVRGGAMNLEQTVTFDNLAYWEFPPATGGTLSPSGTPTP
jgi:hypothetical protein